MPRIDINDTLSIDEAEIELTFIRAGGPGGQNVNKVATAAQLRFDVRNSPSLPDAVRTRLATIAGRKLTLDGVIVITAQRHRTQEGNRKDAIDRLVDLIAKAAVRPKFRVPTKVSHAQKQQRLETKTKRAGVKKLRSEKIRSEE